MPTVITCGIFTIYQGLLVLLCAEFAPSGCAFIPRVIGVTQLINNAQIANNQGFTITVCKSDFI
jgi:hypothetical protein